MIRLTLVGLIAAQALLAGAAAQDSKRLPTGTDFSSSPSAGTAGVGTQPSGTRKACKPHRHSYEVRKDVDIMYMYEMYVHNGKVGTIVRGLLTTSGKFVYKTKGGGWKSDDPKRYFDKFHPFEEGKEKAEGAKYLVGHYVVRIVAPYGDLYSKGWMGSDEYDDLSFSLHVLEGLHMFRNRWNGGCKHTGVARLKNEISCHTMLQAIGGDAFGGGYAGTIQPMLHSEVTNLGVGGGGTDVGIVNYRHEASTVTVINISASGGFSAKSGANASVNVSTGVRFESKDPHMSVQAWPVVKRSGEATSPASNEIDNKLRLRVYTNDMLAVWDMSIRNLEFELAIYESEEDDVQ